VVALLDYLISKLLLSCGRFRWVVDRVDRINQAHGRGGFVRLVT